MLVLHGIYDNGKVEITDKDLPEIKTAVEIIINNKAVRKNRFHGFLNEKINIQGHKIPSREDIHRA